MLEQRIGRIHRLGQRQPIEVYNLVAETGIEARIAALVRDKQALFAGLFDGQSDTVAFESLANVASLLAQVEVQSLPDGRVAFAAPVPTAAALAELLQGMARLLTPPGM